MTKKNVLFYGHFSGWSSYPTVCKAIANWLHDNKPEEAQLLLCDLRREGSYECVRHIDRIDPFSQMRISTQNGLGMPEGAANIYKEYTALMFGFPTWWGLLPQHERRIGYHVCDVDTIPDEWALELQGLDEVIAPSSWCLGVFRHHVPKLKCSKVQHGVHLFDYDKRVRKSRRLRFVHFCSSPALERKGTAQLARAWLKSGLGKEVDLDCYATFEASQKELMQTAFTRTITKPASLPSEFNRLLQTYDAVICPSRAEGFGIIPLEAACHGIPVLGTSGTGHNEHHFASMHEDLKLDSVEMGPCPPGPGYAPIIDETQLEAKLQVLVKRFDYFREKSLQKAETVRAHWNWDAVLRRGRLLKSLGW